MKRLFLALLLVLSTMVFASEKTEILSDFNGIKPGQKAPPFGASDLLNNNKAVGLERTLKQEKVKGVVLSIFGTYCMACVKGVQLLNDNKDQLEKKGIIVLLVSYMEASDIVEKWAREKGIKLITLNDKFGEKLKAYGMSQKDKATLPKTFLIDKKMNILSILESEGEDYISVIMDSFK